MRRVDTFKTIAALATRTTLSGIDRLGRKRHRGRVTDGKARYRAVLSMHHGLAFFVSRVISGCILLSINSASVFIDAPRWTPCITWRIKTVSRNFPLVGHKTQISCQMHHFRTIQSCASYNWEKRFSGAIVFRLIDETKCRYDVLPEGFSGFYRS